MMMMMIWQWWWSFFWLTTEFLYLCGYICFQMRTCSICSTQRARQETSLPFSRYWTTWKSDMMPAKYPLMMGKSQLQCRDCCVVVVVITRLRCFTLHLSLVILLLFVFCCSTVLTLRSSMLSLSIVMLQCINIIGVSNSAIAVVTGCRKSLAFEMRGYRRILKVCW